MSPENGNFVAEISLFVSVVSLVIASLVFYFSYFKKAKVKPIIGPEIHVYHHDYDFGISTAFVIPISFFNDASTIGHVIRTSFVIQKSDKSEDAFYLQWRKFEVLNEQDKKWVHESEAHPLVLPPKSGVHKNIWIIWYAYNPRKLFLDKGKYTLSTYLWTNESDIPKKIDKEFIVTEEQVALLKNNRETKTLGAIRLNIDKELEVNKILSEKELKRYFDT